MLTKFFHPLKRISISFIVKMYIHQKTNNNLWQEVLYEDSNATELFKYLEV